MRERKVLFRCSKRSESETDEKELNHGTWLPGLCNFGDDEPNQM